MAVYYSNIGLDQLMEESSIQLSQFAHWAVWIKVLAYWEQQLWFNLAR